MTKKRLEQGKKDFLTVARMTQAELKNHLTDVLTRHGYATIVGDGYLYARGADALLTAHMDTVHKETVKNVHRNTLDGDIILSSPQGIGGDDRGGVFIIRHLLPKLIASGIRPAVLFCEDEEIGGIGSGKFCRTEFITELSDLNFLIQLDRANSHDAVFYDDDNQDFHKYVTRVTGYKEAQGSFSDISNLCPACGVSGVNLSVGYYNPHRLEEYVSVREMLRTADVTEKLIVDAHNNPQRYEYKEKRYTGAFSNVYDWYCGCEFTYIDPDTGKTVSDIAEGDTLEECAGAFLMMHPEIRWVDVLDYYLI